MIVFKLQDIPINFMPLLRGKNHNIHWIIQSDNKLYFEYIYKKLCYVQASPPQNN